MKIAQRTLLFIALLGLAVKAGAESINDVYVVHFVLDGANKNFLHEQIEKGELPNLKAAFFDKGAVFNNAITTFPTVSSPGYVAFTTGLSAGNSGIFFLEWFDRAKRKTVGYLTPSGFKKVNSDPINQLSLEDSAENALYSPMTLFEQLSPNITASVYAPFRRGATIGIPKGLPASSLWSGLVIEDGLALNKTAMKELDRLFSKSTAKIPRYTLVGLYGTDFYGHHTGPRSEEVAFTLKQFDVFFKQFSDLLAKKGILDKTYFIVSSDHGMHASGEVLKIRDYLWQKGIHREDKIYISNRGVSSTFIYVAGDGGWEDLPTMDHLRTFPTKEGPVDLIQILLENEKIDWLAARQDADHIHIFDRNGEGEIFGQWIGAKHFFTYSYKGEDPLGFAQDPNMAPLLDGTPHAEGVWLEKTLNAQKPNAVVELGLLFQDPRAGDILAVAKDPWSFRTAKAGTHGSLSKDDMEIPLWMAGPGIPQGNFSDARGVDLYPTVLNWFGLASPANLEHQEGKILFASTQDPEAKSADLWLARLEREIMNLPPLYKLPTKEALTEKLNQMLPPDLKKEILKTCESEINSRYQRWKKIDRLEEEAENPNNDLKIPSHLKKNTDWLLTNEKNIEFMRLRRMEDIKTILENP